MQQETFLTERVNKVGRDNQEENAVTDLEELEDEVTS